MIPLGWEKRHFWDKILKKLVFYLVYIIKKYTLQSFILVGLVFVWEKCDIFSFCIDGGEKDTQKLTFLLNNRYMKNLEIRLLFAFGCDLN